MMNQIYIKIQLVRNKIKAIGNQSILLKQYHSQFFIYFNIYYPIIPISDKNKFLKIYQNLRIQVTNSYLLQQFPKYLQINLAMARTKQTARKCCAGKAPRKNYPSGHRNKASRGILSKSKPFESQIKQEQLEDIPDVNTQQFSLRFDDQQKCQEDCVVGDIIKCKACQAILTSQSKIFTNDEYKSLKTKPGLSDAKKQKFLADFENVWICQFCLIHNNISRTFQVSKPENPCFLIQRKRKGKSMLNSDSSNKMLIFCIDISGSMDTKAIPGGHSRLQSVQEAIIQQVNRMKVEKQEIKVGLITFGNYVTLIGDGKNFKQQKLDHKIYHSFEQIVNYCGKIENFCEPIDKSFKQLKNVIQNLAVYGATALGPALTAAVQIASKGAVGSKVIICTDGQANVGIGGMMSPTRFTYYSDMAEYAKKKRVMVNILSLKGDRCNIKELGKLSIATGGAIMKIDPNALGTQFCKITQENVLGSNSELTVKLNKIFRICNVDPQACSKDKTTFKQDFGNFTAQTQLTFEFEVLHKDEASQIPEIDIDLYQKDRIPMQIQLSYIGRDGSQFLQVITDWRELTNDAKAIYEGANFGLFAASVLQRASKKIKQQQFKEAQSIIKGYWSIVKETFSKTEKAQQLEKFKQRVEKVERILSSKMIKAGVIKQAEKQKPQSENSDENQQSQVSDKRGRGRKRVYKKKNESRKSRSRSRDCDNNKKSKKDKDKKSKRALIESDDQQQVLFYEMRARSRSISPPKDKNKKSKTK